MSDQNVDERRNLIEAIKTPLGFFSMVVLVVEALFGGLALGSSGTDRTFLLYAVVGILVLVILLVSGIAISRPEALWGKRYTPLDDTLASGLGGEIHLALDGYLSNLEDPTRDEAYRTLERTITTSPFARTKITRRFCEVMVKEINRRAEITPSRGPKMIGVMDEPAVDPDPK
jgi:hypothetical protein